RDVNNQLPSPNGKPCERGIAFVTTGVLVVIAPESDDARPPHPWFLLGHSSHEGNESSRVFPLFLVRDGSNMSLGADACGFGLEFSHIHLRRASKTTFVAIAPPYEPNSYRPRLLTKPSPLPELHDDHAGQDERARNLRGHLEAFGSRPEQPGKNSNQHYGRQQDDGGQHH